MPRTRSIAAAAISALAAVPLLAAPASAGGPVLQDPSQVPPEPADPVVTVSDAVAYEADGAIVFSVTLDEPATESFSVDLSEFQHVDTTAADFGIGGGTAHFEPGDTTSSIWSVLTTDDGVEDPEQFTFDVLEGPDHQVGTPTVTGTILDGDGPQLDVLDASATEGDPGDGNHVAVEIEASYAPLEDLTFRLHSGIFGFEAEPDADFEPIDEIVTLPAGEVSVTVPLPIVGDDLVEDHELLPVYGEDPSAGAFTLNGASAIMTIDDDDLPTMSIDDVTLAEGTGGPTGFHFTVSLDQPPVAVVTATVTAHAGTATTPDDWQAVPVDLTFQPGETTKDVVVSVVGDAVVEDDETFTVELSNVVDADVGDGSGLGTVVDDDGAGGSSDDSDTAGSSDTGADDPEVLDQGATGLADRLARTGQGLGVLTVAGALVLGLGMLLIVLAAARRSRDLAS